MVFHGQHWLTALFTSNARQMCCSLTGRLLRWTACKHMCATTTVGVCITFMVAPASVTVLGFSNASVNGLGLGS